MSNKEKLMRAAAFVYAGITVKEYNEMFSGMSEEEISRWIKLFCVVCLKGGSW